MASRGLKILEMALKSQGLQLKDRQGALAKGKLLYFIYFYLLVYYMYNDNKVIKF